MEFDIQTLISNIGFPITLSMYLLIRIEGKLLNLTDSINNLSNNILSIKKG
ncbi:MULTISPECIES: YvrJ family protein [Romboutsia]|uniref:YvrJ protein family n=1 Tax=Romboutsia hominis TaxID=1507512 RepID=A0A2P2BQ63_9FIRM|nr:MULTISPECIES: YvrJ family protein [unclassified Romboutsia]CEI72466.1 YvrJ protein family [Romboutsia hominis]MDB8791719.1 YvrJ family protein [Romboutsia sp. 1001216sp1]MDB8792557.1 YvrJ family protein [Romboutsia sp. 1001216sp1]MDB8796275.1 YvrJ family protein [Romboutsia sp. 1001216sp1]MDB8798269.1 YvrJ family protein [Romboutsia sp. 1001216sp1]